LKSASLWPSLASIRSEFYPELNAKPLPAATSASFSRPSKAALREVMGPLQDLVKRRANLAARKFSPEWAPGRLVPIKVLASVRPVLLDQLVGPDQWRAFMVAPECDWAGYSDVLLEPNDEPFDPICGMVQTWNSVLVRRQQRASDNVLGELSANRLATIRKTSTEVTFDFSDVGSEPGVIALRSLNNGTAILTGTKLNPQDIRLAYRAVYSDLSAAISN
jgi:hypothetical protein